MRVFYKLSLSLLFAMPLQSLAQQYKGTPVGQWTSFYTYNQATAIANDGETLFVGTKSGFCTYNKTNGSLETFSRSSGMATAGISAVAHDLLTEYTIIGYDNSNIDLFHNNSFYNIPDLFLSQLTGNKRIYNIVCKAGTAYMGTGKGLMLVNLNKREIKQTVVFYDNGAEQVVYGVAFLDETIYVATTAGIYKTSITNPNFQYYANWDKVSDNAYNNIIINAGKVYAATNTYVDEIVSPFNEVRFYDSPYTISNINTSSTGALWVSHKEENGTLGGSVLLTTNGTETNNIIDHSVAVVSELDNGEIFFGDTRKGLQKKIQNGEYASYMPNGLSDYRSFDVYAHGNDFAVANGGYDANNLHPFFNQSNFTIYQDGNYRNFPWVSNTPFMEDFVRIVRSPKTKSYYTTAFMGGLLEITSDFNLITYSDPYFDPRVGEFPERTFAFGIAIDEEDNVWVVNNGNPSILKIKGADGNWYKSRNITNPLTTNLPLSRQFSASDVIIDEYNNKWITTIGNNGGLIVYSHNNTLDDNSDDQYRVLQKGKGLGNLPSNTVNAVAADKKGNIWVGTDNGIGVIYCGYDIFNGCDGDIPVLPGVDENDTIPATLFQGQLIQAIAVDGGNRKWVGTNSGLWLVSESGEETIEAFTTDNSPLPSNVIQRININPINGDVFISTDNGLVCYRGTATDGGEKNEKPLFIYPNPVPQGYSGMIAIRGLAENSDVRITDISGQLVYRTKANGGEAVWDGKDYLGKRAQTGVYIVLATTKEGAQKTSGKIIFRE